MSRKIFVLFIAAAIAAALLPQTGLAWGKKKNKEDNKEAAAPTTPPAPVLDPAVQQKVRDLITLIETPPTGLYVNNNGQVNAPPDHQPYNPDGSRNQNFTVTHNTPGGNAINVNYEDKRKQATMELIAIGKPAVDELCKALVRERYLQRHLYAFALGEIKDPRAVPALLKYYTDGREKLKNVEFIRQNGDAATAAKLEQTGKEMIGDSVSALSKITGQNHGDDFNKWQGWWNANKDKVGPTPDLVEFTANPSGSSTDKAVHFDPSLAEPAPK